MLLVSAHAKPSLAAVLFVLLASNAQAEVLEDLASTSDHGSALGVLHRNFRSKQDLSSWLRKQRAHEISRLTPWSAQAVLTQLDFHPSLTNAIFEAESETYRLPAGRDYRGTVLKALAGLPFGAAFVLPYIIIGQPVPSNNIWMALMISAGWIFLTVDFYSANEQDLLDRFVTSEIEEGRLESHIDKPILSGLGIRCVKSLVHIASQASGLPQLNH